METDPSTLMGLAIEVLYLIGMYRVVVLCREALRDSTEFEAEVKGPLFSLRLKTRRELPEGCASNEDGMSEVQYECKGRTEKLF
jgi:hypothetical protein